MTATPLAKGLVGSRRSYLADSIDIVLISISTLGRLGNGQWRCIEGGYGGYDPVYCDLVVSSSPGGRES